MDKKTGYRTITYRFRLYCDRMDWLEQTKQMYNRVLAFYYDVIQREPGIWEVPKLQLMRELECMTVGTKADAPEDVKYPVPFEKVPLYFRRAAINDAIRLSESLRTGREHGAKQAESFHASPIYYKGMYKEFTSTSVSLKLFNGDKWVWVDCSIDTCGRAMPSPEQMMSPVIVMEKGRAMLHVPVKEEVDDVRTVKERLGAEEKLCAVYFPNADTMAVLVVMDPDGTFVESKFIRGGKELVHRKKQLLARIEKNRKSMGYDREHPDRVQLPTDENKSLKEKIHRITDDAAHKVSREIVEFCKEREIGVIVVPAYRQGIDLNRMGYVLATGYDWLGRRIISYLKYKSFGDGIVTATVSIAGITSKCYQCGETVQKKHNGSHSGKTKSGGKSYECPNGHTGNAYFNCAMNIGRNFVTEMKKYRAR